MTALEHMANAGDAPSQSPKAASGFTHSYNGKFPGDWLILISSKDKPLHLRLSSAAPEARSSHTGHLSYRGIKAERFGTHVLQADLVMHAS